MKLIKEDYIVGQKVKIKNSSPFYNGRIATIYSLRKNSPSKLITVKLDNGTLQQFEPFQLERVLGENMKLLKEDYGESEELDNFVYQIERRFREYYEVTLSLDGRVSRKYFAFEDAAKTYYDNLVKEANEDKEYYDGAKIEFKAIEVLRDEEDIDYTYIDYEEE